MGTYDVGINTRSSDHVLEWKKANNVPLSRRNYFALAFFDGNPQLDANLSYVECRDATPHWQEPSLTILMDWNGITRH